MPFLEKIAVRLINEHYDKTESEARIEYRKTTGLPFVQQMNLMYPEGSKNDTIVKMFEQQKISKIFEQDLFPETIKVFQQLLKFNYRIAISSSTTSEIVLEYVERKKISSYVSDLLGYRPGFEKGKDHFAFIMKKYSLEPNNLIFIGDSLKDMERAYNSNVHFIGRISQMFTANDFKLKVSEDKLIQFPTISSLEEIFELIHNK